MAREESEFTLTLFIKLGFIAAIFSILPIHKAILATLVITVCYRYVIAAVLGLKVMATMDLNTFITSSKAPLNCVNLTPLSQSRSDLAYEVFGRLAKRHLKMRSKIVKVFGDYYYKEIDFDEVMKTCITILPPKTLKCKEDLEKFFGQIIGEPFPLNRPQW